MGTVTILLRLINLHTAEMRLTQNACIAGTNLTTGFNFTQGFKNTR